MKKYWSVIVIAALILFIAVSGVVNKCEIKHSENTVIQVNEEQIKNKILDSIMAEQTKKDIKRIDSINRLYEKKITPLKKEIESLKIKLAEQINEYEADTTVQSKPCDSIIKTAGIVIDSLDQEIKLLAGIKENMQLKIESISISRDISERNLIASYLETDRLKKEIKIQTNWWHRNDKWFYMGAGVVLAILIKGAK